MIEGETYIKKTKRPQINTLMMHLRVLGKEKPNVEDGEK
jgi:hypothetical protein